MQYDYHSFVSVFAYRIVVIFYRGLSQNLTLTYFLKPSIISSIQRINSING